MYFVHYDSGTHFSGMNYPFGDNVVYADNQPLLSWLLKGLYHINVFNPDHIIGLINLLLLASLLLTAYFVSLILSIYEVSDIVNILFSVGITLMSPQVLRYFGHYGLAFSCLIPSIWYFIIRYLSHKKWFNGYWLLIVIVSVAFTFIHVYYSLLLLLFIAGIGISYPFFSRSISMKNIMLIAAALLPVIIILTYQKLTDPITDRIEQPYGMSVYVANAESVLLPLEYNQFNIHKIFSIPIKYNYEGLSYIGITGTLFVLFVLFNLGWSFIKRRPSILKKVSFHPTLSAVLVCSVFMLIVSFGWPFIFNEDLFAKIFPPIRNFRSLGRMSWAFYYAITLFCSVSIVKLCYQYRMVVHSGMYLIIILLSSAFWWMDGIHHLIATRNVAYMGQFTADFLDNSFYNSIINETDYKTDDFQCILSLPYFEVGSEKFYLENGDPYLAMKLCYQSGLPMINKLMTRSSISQTLLTVQCAGDSLLPKTIFKILPSKKPVLLVVNNLPLTNGEQFLIRHSTPIYSNHNLKLYALYPDTILNQKPMQHYIAQSSISDSTRIVTDTASHLTGLNYVAYPSQKDFVSYTLTASLGNNTLLDSIFSISNDSIIDLSFWMKVDRIKAAFPYIRVEVFDEKGDKYYHDDEIHPKLLSSVYQDWLRIHYTMTLPINTFRLRITLPNSDHVVVSRLLLRQSNIHYPEQIGGKLAWFDNYPVW